MPKTSFFISGGGGGGGGGFQSRGSVVNPEADSPRTEEASSSVDNHVTRERLSTRWKEAFLGCHRENLDELMEQFTRVQQHLRRDKEFSGQPNSR